MEKTIAHFSLKGKEYVVRAGIIKTSNLGSHDTFAPYVLGLKTVYAMPGEEIVTMDQEDVMAAAREAAP